MGVEDEFTHWIGHEEARIATHGDQLPDFGGGNLQLGHGVNDKCSPRAFMQIADAPRASIHQKLAQAAPCPARASPDGAPPPDAPTAAVPATDATSAGSRTHPCRRSGTGCGPDTRAAVRPGFPPNRRDLPCAPRDRRPRILAGPRTANCTICSRSCASANGLIAVRRIAGREKADLLEAQRLLQFECGSQVRVVNRIERAAKNAHWVHWVTLPDSALGLQSAGERAG